ncbi:hypothetical protein BM523_16700 [Alteromonas mediterranea]|uniref:outer membrane beta-barrel protein n=1 Tax=Alteromonas mediterranea TaxID=314275 RepID=UPI0009038071|nr:outer membrane beta-barrel protein [Alteromonas mediterranea]APD95503.1 hypothetical protein BM523_16700 [Alteromonas mediterranea]APD99137.1 hypothetical protein BM525_16720 [Alteromonas mediterranea]QDG36377.1 hypothetical protein FJN13_16825 [Alteromonas mediterranea]
MRFVIQPLALLSLIFSIASYAETDVLLRGTWALKENTQSFQDFGRNHQRFDNDGLHLSQAVISTNQRLSDDWTISGVLNGYTDGEERINFSQLYLKYRPLSASTIKPEIKIGAFYPAISAENTDFGWLSPHFLTNSAINSWIGEELRTGGIELSFRQSGRQVRSNWSWKILGSLFKGNDTTGTLLSWRGFALHDRQSLYNDRVNFLPIPGVVDEDGLGAPAWTEPFREIDNRFGYYFGAHVAYKRSAEMRYYYYDNNADANAVDPDRIYAWHTRFHSLTLRYLPRPELTLFSQLLYGDTLMGENIVDNDFASAYIAAALDLNAVGLEDLTAAARIDWYRVSDNDNTMYDPNESRGYAFTFSVKYDVTSHFAIMTEWQLNSGHQENLRFFQPNEKYTEHLFQVALTATL